MASVWTIDVEVSRDTVVEGDNAVGDGFTPGTPEQMLRRASPKAIPYQAGYSIQA